MEAREVAQGVVVATSRRETTTTTVVARDGEAVIVDPAWDPDELDALADLLAARRWRVVAGLATHAHHDHLLWHPRFGDVPRLASARTAALAARHRAGLVAALGPDWPPALADLVGRVSPLPAAPELTLLGEPVVAVVHDGHAPGHTAWWWPARGLLVAGDVLSDVELPLPLDPDDLGAYLAGLDVLAPYVHRAGLLVPGHGHPTTSPAARLAADRGYLEALAAGDDPVDPRRGHPGMAEVHTRVRALARAQRTSVVTDPAWTARPIAPRRPPRADTLPPVSTAPGTRPLNAAHDDDPEGYDALRQGWLNERRARRVERTLAATTGPVLEIGAGTGGLLARLAATHPDRRFVGVEPLANYVDYAQGRAVAAAGDITYVVGTGEELPELPAGTVPVGAVLTNDALHHMQDLARVVRQVTRASRAGTRWLAIEPDRVNPYVWAHHRFVPGEANFAPRPFERLLAAWGWRRVDRHRLFLVPPAVRRPPGWLRAVERRLEVVPGVAGGLALEYELGEAPAGAEEPG